jgi:hypothetical protein
MKTEKPQADKTEWIVHWFPNQGTLEVHIYPDGGDEPKHQAVESCWCNPTLSREEKNKKMFEHKRMQ